MRNVLPGDGVIRKLWAAENDAYGDHLLRLDPESRNRRFSGGASDDFIRRHAHLARGVGVVLYGFFVDGTLRGASELRHVGSPLAGEAEAALSVEQSWQSRGVGTELLRCTLLTARNRGIKSLHMHCLADNRRMQQLARKFAADFSFDFGSVTGNLLPPRSTALSMAREALADGHAFANAVFDAQSRLLGAA
ncbi:MAG: GNAT family N-acetyltransferase [Pseudolabrys sp.]